MDLYLMSFNFAIFLPGKSKSSNKRNKSKTKAEKDRLLYRRESNYLDDVDDVSSTTTESSGGDIEIIDKVSFNLF